MARPNQRAQRRLDYIPLISRTFVDLGYRRTTTAALAQQCEVRENVLYRLWPDKRAMFIAALDYVYQYSEQTWDRLLEDAVKGEGRAENLASPAQIILEYEANHHGEFGLYRLVFTGLSETDDPQIKASLKDLYQRFHGFVQKQVDVHRNNQNSPGAASLIAWSILGLGTVANIGRELGILGADERQQLIKNIGGLLLDVEIGP
jgi:AcrR family transcriptional regulator